MLSITNRTKKSFSRVQFGKIKDQILGRRYELSLVFCGNALSRRLNRAYRGKDKPANVLSFPLSKSFGEIFINLSNTGGFSVTHLFIHACLHLKGMDHGDTMDKLEKKFLQERSLNKNVSPNRRRN